MGCGIVSRGREGRLDRGLRFNLTLTRHHVLRRGTLHGRYVVRNLPGKRVGDMPTHVVLHGLCKRRLGR